MSLTHRIITPVNHTVHLRSNSRVTGTRIARCILAFSAGALLLSCGPVTDREPLREYLLKGRQAEAWQRIERDFYDHAFLPCLAAKKVKVSCSGCTGVILRGVIHIDRAGRMTGFDRTYRRYCGEDMPPDVEECLIRFFEGVQFPREIRGVSLEVDLGRALKC